jgi:phosphate transport system substrate-binding protein
MGIVGKLGCGALVLALGLAGCGGSGAGSGGGATSPSAKLSGTVLIDGSSTVFRISKVAQAQFVEVAPDVTVVVDNHGTGGGFSRYLQGEVDIIDASRDAKHDEESKSKEKGIEWTRFLVGYDGITLVVHPENTWAKSLSVAQLKAVFEPKSKVKTWKDVDPSWPAKDIVLYSPDKDSGTFEFFTDVIVGKARSQREDIQVSPDDNVLVNGVAKDTYGLGYFGYAYFAANQTKLRAVPVQKGDDDKPVLPDKQTILDKSYSPLSRPLYIFVKNSAMARPEVSAFVKYYLENVAKLAEKAGYVAPTADDRAANEKALSAAPPSGSAPIDASSKK